MTTSTFSGFGPETFAFLSDLADHNDKEWFRSTESQRRYKAHYTAPAKAFIVAAGAELARFEPEVQAAPSTRGALGPINRDIRFSPDKAPYNPSLRFNFLVGEGHKRNVPAYVAFLHTDHLLVGAGTWPFDKARLQRYREAVASGAGAALAEALDAARAEGFEPDGMPLKRVPKPWSADHPRAELLKNKALRVGKRLSPPPAECGGAGFAAWQRSGKLRYRVVSRRCQTSDPLASLARNGRFRGRPAPCAGVASRGDPASPSFPEGAWYADAVRPLAPIVGWLRQHLS